MTKFVAVGLNFVIILCFHPCILFDIVLEQLIKLTFWAQRRELKWLMVKPMKTIVPSITCQSTCGRQCVHIIIDDKLVIYGSPRACLLLIPRAQRYVLTFRFSFPQAFWCSRDKHVRIPYAASRDQIHHRLRFCCDSFFTCIFWCSFRHRFKIIDRTEMANVKQTQKMIPYITCEISLGQYVCELVFGVNVFDLDFRNKLIRSNNHNQSRATLWVLETCLIVGPPSLYNNLDHCFVVFKHIQHSLWTQWVSHSKAHCQREQIRTVVRGWSFDLILGALARRGMMQQDSLWPWILGFIGLDKMDMEKLTQLQLNFTRNWCGWMNVLRTQLKLEPMCTRILTAWSVACGWCACQPLPSSPTEFTFQQQKNRRALLIESTLDSAGRGAGSFPTPSREFDAQCFQRPRHPAIAQVPRLSCLWLASRAWLVSLLSRGTLEAPSGSFSSRCSIHWRYRSVWFTWYPIYVPMARRPKHWAVRPNL